MFAYIFQVGSYSDDIEARDSRYDLQFLVGHGVFRDGKPR